MSVILRPYRPEDFERICDIRGLDTPERRERFIKRLEKPGEWFDHYFHLAIEADGTLVGDLQLRHCDWTTPTGAWDLGIELADDVRGKGIGTQALIAATKYSFDNGAHRIQGSTEENNHAMRRAFEKAGWRYEGVLKALFLENGIPQDYHSYAITKFD
jgi:RimJ/RimL family protein N-acetyltransferase